MAAAGAADSYVEDNADPGMHRRTAVDIITIVSGECVVVLEEAETVLKAGDTFIQRGTKHAWRITGDQPCVHSTLMVGRGASRSPCCHVDSTESSPGVATPTADGTDSHAVSGRWADRIRRE